MPGLLVESWKLFDWRESIVLITAESAKQFSWKMYVAQFLDYSNFVAGWNNMDCNFIDGCLFFVS